MCKKVQVFKYKIVEVFPLSDLEKHKDHKRLRVFYNKGVICVNCQLEATQLILGRDNGGGLHLDVYDDNFYPLTIDHIIPKSKGGSNELSNLDPMCAKCNFNKGNQLDWDGITKGSFKQIPNSSQWIKGNFVKPGNLEVGQKVYFKGKKNQYKEIGIVSDFKLNIHISEVQFMIEGNDKSMYHINRAFIQL